MGQIAHRTDRVAALLACGALLCLLAVESAHGQANPGPGFVPSAGAWAPSGAAYGSTVDQTGWATPSGTSAPTYAPVPAREYSLPGNPVSPVVIDNGPTAPGSWPPSAYPQAAYPSNACPPGSYAPGSYAPSNCPPGSCPPGPYPAGNYPPPSYAPLPGAQAEPYPANPPPDVFLTYAKSGWLQRAEFDTTYVPRNGGGGVGFTDLDGFSLISIPITLAGEKSVLLLSPDLQTHFVDGPDFHDLPHQLYDANLLVQFIGQMPDNLLLYAGLEPGWHSDGRDTTSKYDFRTAVYGAIGYRFSPTLAVALGVGYLDRRDIGLMPLPGLMWVPDPDTRFELIPPKPRIERRIYAGDGYDDWIYVGGEMGGGQWAIDDADGAHDVASYLDYRLLFGVERRTKDCGIGGRAEIAYVFGRRLEFASGGPTYDPPDTVMARLGLSY